MTISKEIMEKIAYCGLYCGSCEHYLKTKQNDLSELSARSGASEKLVSCDGCRTGNVSMYCLNCSLKKCARGKNISHCGECDIFPCPPLSAFQNDGCPHHAGVIANLKEINQADVIAFVETQRKRWSCKNCGTEYSWYQKNCENCDSELDCFCW